MTIFKSNFDNDLTIQPPSQNNPATNLPMQNDSVDDQGNPFGVDLHGGYPPVNPNSGLPINGSSGFDVGGNFFGTNFNDPFSNH